MLKPIVGVEEGHLLYKYVGVKCIVFEMFKS